MTETVDKTLADPKFAVGDRVFSHYVMDWGTISKIGQTTEPTVHGVTGDPLPGSTWYTVRFDKGITESLDDAGGNWDLARIVPPDVARRYGWGDDPRVAR